MGGLFSSLRALPRRWRTRAELRGRRLLVPSAATGPVLAFGEPAPRPGAVVHGGRVKLQALRAAFPCDEAHFNVLYLVSSAIPPAAEELVQWARGQGAKLVWNQNGVGFPAWAGHRTGQVNRPMQRLLRQADFVVYQSEFCQVSAERYLGRPECPAEVWFNPVDLARFAPAPQPPSSAVWRLLAAGTHNQAQRVLGALETVRLLRAAGRAVHLTIAGKLNWPRAAEQVREAITRGGLGSAVTLIGPFTQEEAARLLRESHVLLHAKYHDPCPTMVIESLACGVPVIGSRSGGMAELVSEDGGALLQVPLSWEAAAYPEPAAWARAVAQVMAEWPRASAAARARAKRLFAQERWVEAHREIFTRLLA